MFPAGSFFSPMLYTTVPDEERLGGSLGARFTVTELGAEASKLASMNFILSVKHFSLPSLFLCLLIRDQSRFRFNLEQRRPHIVETEAEVPHSLTALHLSLSDFPLEGMSAKYTEFEGCYRLFK